MTSDTPAANPLDELHALRTFFANAQNNLRAGKIVNMTGIDQRIAAVCELVKGAEPEQQKAYLPELTVLIELLNLYERDLRRLQAALDNVAAEKDQDLKGEDRDEP